MSIYVNSEPSYLNEPPHFIFQENYSEIFCNICGCSEKYNFFENEEICVNCADELRTNKTKKWKIKL